MWWSGFFALAAVVHLVRVVLQAQAVLAGRSIPMSLSVGVAIAAGLVSFFFYKKGCGSCGCSSK
jgi:hypothetical protein